MIKMFESARFAKISFSLVVLVTALSFLSPSLWALSRPASYGSTQEKKCEKCERDKDGKMVCRPVTCP